MEFRHFCGNTYIIEGFATQAAYMLPNGHIILIDNGLSEEEDDLIQTLEENHLIPDYLLCTHLHRDHHGNSKPLMEKYDCKLIMSEGEAYKCGNLMTLRRYVEYPYRNSFYKRIVDDRMYCRADITIPPEADHIDIEGFRFGILHTPGHSCDHISIVTPDHVCFIGDVIMPAEAVAAAKLPYTEDFLLDSASKLSLCQLDCDHWIFSHKGTYVGDICEHVQANVEKMDELLEMMYHLMDQEPMTRDELYRAARASLRLYKHDPRNINEYKRMFRPYLEHLLNAGRIQLQDQDGIVYYGHFETEI